jgi:hypothetical protein
VSSQGADPESKTTSLPQGLRRQRLRCQHLCGRVVSETDLIPTMARGRAHGQPVVHRVLPFPLEVPDDDAYLYWHGTQRQIPRIGGCAICWWRRSDDALTKVTQGFSAR